MLFLFLMAILLTGFSACEQEDSASPVIDEVVTTGTWKVHYYYDDKDETYKFNGYNFTFGNDGKLTATFSGQTKTGTWSVNTSSNKFIITISGTDALDDMSDDWLIVERKADFISLKDDNPDRKEELHLGKN